MEMALLSFVFTWFCLKFLSAVRGASLEDLQKFGVPSRSSASSGLCPGIQGPKDKGTDRVVAAAE